MVDVITERCACTGAGAGAIDEPVRSELQSIIDRRRGEAGALIQVLHEAQNLFGYLPSHVQEAIAQGLDIPVSEVYGVVTFYSYFTMVPRGLHVVRVCMGTACYVRGAGELLEQIQRELGVKVPGTTDDGVFTVETVRCLGACSLAPVMLVDKDIYREVKPRQVAELLARYRGEALASAR